jgi:hypothetical protein
MAIKTDRRDLVTAGNAAAPGSAESPSAVEAKEPSASDDTDYEEDVYENFPGWNPTRW